ncbi:MAG: phosphoglycerate dehydrogenase [Planctomycetes bacterium]|nr:phosphoglycerate dehydrogenase [Planctomycetota bacterium]
MPRILVMPAHFRHAPGPYRQVLEQAGFDIRWLPVDPLSLSRGQLIEQLQGIDGVIAGGEIYSEEVFANTKLRCVARAGVGYDAVDVPAATRHGVPVVITPGTNEHSVAEQALAMIFACFRNVVELDRLMREGTWKRTALRRLAGNTLGIVGLGRIGKALTVRARGLGLNVVGYDPFADQKFCAENGVKLCTFDELLAQSDIVSLHIPCTAETTDIINAKSLAKMKPGSVLINTSRGGLVDEVALLAALKNGPIAMAGLDVFKVEPLPADSPLLKLPNVVVAPHMGGIDQDALDAMGGLAAQCLVDLHAARWPTGCVVNEELHTGYRW